MLTFQKNTIQWTLSNIDHLWHRPSFHRHHVCDPWVFWTQSIRANFHAIDRLCSLCVPETPSRASTQAGDACTRVSRLILLLTDGRVCARSPTYTFNTNILHRQVSVFRFSTVFFVLHSARSFPSVFTRVSLSRGLAREDPWEREREARIYVDRRGGSTNISSPQGFLEGSKEEPPPPHDHTRIVISASSRYRNRAVGNNDRRSGLFSLRPDFTNTEHSSIFSIQHFFSIFSVSFFLFFSILFSVFFLFLFFFFVIF